MGDVVYIIFAAFIITVSIFFIDHLRVVFTNKASNRTDVGIDLLFKSLLEKNNVSFSINESKVNKK